MEDSFNKLVCDTVKWRRKALGLDQGEVAGACGLSRSAYSHVETGRVKWTADVMGVVFRKLGIEVMIIDGKKINTWK